MTTGFIVPNRRRIHAVPSLAALFDVYQNVFVRATGSKYSIALAERYEKYVMAQRHPERVPFLLPEFRYLGAAKKHKYRLDFTILSAERKLRVGIELSPWSSHGVVRGKSALRRKGGEKAVEEKRQERFENEMEKRNAYFKKYGITTLTFAGKALRNTDRVFDQIADYFEPHTDPKAVSAPEVRAKLHRYTFGN